MHKNFNLINYLHCGQLLFLVRLVLSNNQSQTSWKYLLLGLMKYIAWYTYTLWSSIVSNNQNNMFWFCESIHVQDKWLQISYNKSIITAMYHKWKKRKMYSFFQYKLKTTKQLYILYKILENVTGNIKVFLSFEIKCSLSKECFRTILNSISIILVICTFSIYCHTLLIV